MRIKIAIWAFFNTPGNMNIETKRRQETFCCMVLNGGQFNTWTFDE